MWRMKTCPKCKCPCLSEAEFCVCGHKFNPAVDGKYLRKDVTQIWNDLFGTDPFEMEKH